jgi:hypothetical protein
MVDVLFKLVFTIAGLYAVFFNKRLADGTIKYWNGVKPNMYGDKDLKWMRPLFVFNGCLFIVYGLRDLWS